MVYKWKIEKLFPVEAQEAGEELERIYEKYGELQPEKIVEESRGAEAVLHSCFEWNDVKAAEMYRQRQAQSLVNAISVTVERGESKVDYRAFVHVQSTYQPLPVVLNDSEKMQELFECALRELKSFKAKYSRLEKLAPVLEQIDLLVS